MMGLNIWVVVGVIGALVGLSVVARNRPANMLTWAIAWWLGLFIGIRYGFAVPVPASVVTDTPASADSPRRSIARTGVLSRLSPTRSMIRST